MQFPVYGISILLKIYALADLNNFMYILIKWEKIMTKMLDISDKSFAYYWFCATSQATIMRL